MRRLSCRLQLSWNRMRSFVGTRRVPPMGDREHAATGSSRPLFDGHGADMTARKLPLAGSRTEPFSRDPGEPLGSTSRRMDLNSSVLCGPLTRTMLQLSLHRCCPARGEANVVGCSSIEKLRPEVQAAVSCCLKTKHRARGFRWLFLDNLSVYGESRRCRRV